MHFRTLATRRAPSPAALLVSMILACGLLWPAQARAQQVAGGDFDICDFCGDLVANTMHLRGRPGFGTNLGVFVLVNAADGTQDVDKDGFTPGVNFTHLYVQTVTDFVNVADPARVIAASNFVLGDFLNPLNNGFQNNVRVSIVVPP